MIEYAIVGIKKLVVTWIINPCYSYKITTSNKNVQNNVNEMLIVNTFFCMAFFVIISLADDWFRLTYPLAYLSP